MYYVVEASSLRADRVKSFVSDWLKHVKYGLLDDIRRQIVAEGRVGKYMYIIVIRKTLLGLWLTLKLEDLGRKHGVVVSVYEASNIIIDENYINEEIKKRINKIPSHLIYKIKKALVKRKLPRKGRKEIIEAMKH